MLCRRVSSTTARIAYRAVVLSQPAQVPRRSSSAATWATKVTIDVSSKNGDAYAWLTNDSFKVVAKNDDSNGTTNSHISATLPANSDGTATYYIIFTEYYGDDATFKVALQGHAGRAPDYFSCTKTTSDCVAEPQGGCCPHGTKVAVNKNEVTAWETTQTCTTTPRPFCPLYVVDDTRVAAVRRFDARVRDGQLHHLRSSASPACSARSATPASTIRMTRATRPTAAVTAAACASTSPRPRTAAESPRAPARAARPASTIRPTRATPPTAAPTAAASASNSLRQTRCCANQRPGTWIAVACTLRSPTKLYSTVTPAHASNRRMRPERSPSP